MKTLKPKFNLEYQNSPIFNRSQKIIIAITIIIAIVISASSLFLMGASCEGIGCVGLWPLALGGLPAHPFVLILNSAFSHFTYSYSIGGFFYYPSYFKYLYVVLLPLYAFLLMYFLAMLIVGRAKQQEDKLQSSGRNKKLMRLFLKSFLIYLAGSVAIVALSFPVSNLKNTLRVCGENCFPNLVYHMVPDCQNKTGTFVYPVKTTIPPVDKCMWNNFLEKNPFNSVNLSYSDLVIDQLTYSNGSTTEQQYKIPSQLDYLIEYFKPFLTDADNATKQTFCNGFDYREYGNSKSNRRDCILALGLMENYASPEEMISICKQALLNKEWTNSPLQIMCKDKLVKFNKYEIRPEDLDPIFPNGWKFIPQRELFGNFSWYYHTGYHYPGPHNDDDLDLGYGTGIEVSGVKPKQSFSISERSINSQQYKNFIDTANQQLLSQNDATGFYRIFIEKRKINNVDVYVEKVKNSGRSSDEEYYVVDFVLGNTFIQINGSANILDNISNPEQALVSIAEAMIKNNYKF